MKIILFGSGNVTVHLAKAFQLSENLDLIQLYRRDSKNDHLFDLNIPKINSLEKLKEADIYVLAINDDHIAEFSKKLKFTEGLVVHTSGSIGIDQLKCVAHKGVFYPLQTFSKNQKTNRRTP